jgi:hypothetical protein
MRSRRRVLSTLLAVAATVLALYSAWHPMFHMRRLLQREVAEWRGLSTTQKRREPVDHLGIDGQIFDFYSAFLVKGDRVYFQVMPSGFSSDYDLPTLITSIGRFYLLPAMQTTSLKDATVVVSWFEDPAQLHLKFITKVRAGLQPLWVSRTKLP